MKKINLKPNFSRNTLYLNQQLLIQNFNNIRQIVGNNVIIACCVKANAYGMGQEEIVQILEKNLNTWFCIQSLSEGRKIRQMGVKNRILLISAIFEQEVDEIINLNITPIISTVKVLEKFNETVKIKKIENYNIHLFCDTGMGWLGFFPKQITQFALNFNFANLNIEGIATHFASSDENKSLLYDQQVNDFLKLKEDVLRINKSIKYFHCANSGSIIANKNTHLDIIQPGILLYGLFPSTYIKNLQQELYPTLQFNFIASLKSRISGIKTLPKGSSIGYNSTYITDQETLIGLLPIGYYNGIDRKNSNLTLFKFNNFTCKVLGRVGMNSLTVSLENVPMNAIKEGDKVTIFENSQDVENIARLCDTINYEVITRINDVQVTVV